MISQQQDKACWQGDIKCYAKSQLFCCRLARDTGAFAAKPADYRASSFLRL